MKIINMTHSVHVLDSWKTDTMYLSGIKSIVRVFLFFSAVEFYAEQGARYVHHSFYEDR